MQPTSKPVALICSIVIVIFAFLAFACGAKDIAAETEADFKWFSGFGFPDVVGCPYVQVAPGRWSQAGDELRQNHYIYAFLLMKNGPSFRVLTLGMDDETFTNSIDETNEYKRVGFEVLNLKQSADSLIQSLRNPPRNRLPMTRVEAFVLGWACWRQGLNVEAEQLYEQAQRLPEWRQQSESTNSFRVSIEKDLAYAMMWRAVLCFGNPSVTRPQLLAAFDSIATNYLDSEYHEQAVETAAMLRKMIAQDQAHTRTAPANLDQLPMQARVHELIFRLRDQNGRQNSQPGYCDIFDDWSGVNTNTPADQLVRLGYAAVPQLIQALDDPTLTRSVGFWRDFVFSHYVLTVGDCAVDILKRITGTSFFVPTYTSSYMSKDGKAVQTKKAAEAWWAQVQRKGEEQMLIDALSAPSDDAPGQAEILCKKYPDVALQTLERGIEATSDGWLRPQLVRQLILIQGSGVAAFLNREMTNSPVLACRVEAATQLLQLKKGDPVAAMIHEWERLKMQPYENGDPTEQVVAFLANANSPTAIRALGDSIQKCPMDTRMDVVEAAGGQPYWSWTGPTNSAATWAVVEELLVKELEDTEAGIGTSGSINGKSYVDLRVCDMACEILAEQWTNRYVFDLSAPLKTRDRQRIQCINNWRLAHHLPLVPPPPERFTRVKPENATLVTAIEWEAGSVKPGDGFFRTISGFESKRLESSKIVSLLMHYAAVPEPQTVGLVLRAIKDDDLTGVRLLIRLLPGRQLTGSEEYGVSEIVTLGPKFIISAAGGGDRNSYGTAAQWSDFAAAINQALAGDPKVSFEIGVRIQAGSSQ